MRAYPSPFDGRLFVLTLALFAFAGTTLATAAQNDRKLALYQQKYAERQTALAAELHQLASQCRAAGDEQGALEIEAFLNPANSDDQGLQVLPELPRTVQPQLPVGLPPAERAWREKFQQLRRNHADELYNFSREVMQVDLASFSYEILYEVARLDPDHPATRRVLGYVQSGDEWLTPFEVEKRRRKEIWDPRFGWIPSDELPKYEQGLRKYRNRWISVAQEAEIRRDFREAWEISTEHFRVTTNHSLERGVEIAGKLENYYQFFFRAFPGLFNTREQMRALHSPSRSRTVARRNLFEVHVYRDRNEYVARLQPRIPIIAQTNGLYHQGDNVSYFFHAPGNANDATMYHEATHQILFESRARQRDVAQARNFWIVEGFACYMESYRVTDGKVSLGDPWFIRFDNARTRLLVDKYYRLLSSFTSWGMDEFQHQTELPQNYSQSAGLVHFFLHADDGKYRDALIEHIAAMYASRDPNDRDVPPLDRLTGLSFNELDKEYILYLKRQAEDLAARPIPDYVQRELEQDEAGVP